VDARARSVHSGRMTAEDFDGSVCSHGFRVADLGMKSWARGGVVAGLGIEEESSGLHAFTSARALRKLLTIDEGLSISFVGVGMPAYEAGRCRL
jgi:hypothetical protein